MIPSKYVVFRAQACDSQHVICEIKFCYSFIPAVIVYAWLQPVFTALHGTGAKRRRPGKSSMHASSSCVTSGGMNDPWLRLLYTSLELIRSSRVLAAGSAHNVLSVVTYRSVSSRLKVYPVTCYLITSVSVRT